jgi:hypothetical protein
MSLYIVKRYEYIAKRYEFEALFDESDIDRLGAKGILGQQELHNRSWRFGNFRIRLTRRRGLFAL